MSKSQLGKLSVQGDKYGSSKSSLLRRRGPVLSLLAVLLFMVSSIKGIPNIKDTPHIPMLVVEGQNAALTCVVRELGNATVVWKKVEQGKYGPKILTAEESRVTSDERVRVFHDAGGDVWVLAIASTQTSDSGMYICEVNTTPVLRSFHNLTVLSLSIQAPNETGRSEVAFDNPFSYKGSGSIMGHNYTDCCVTQNVSKSCLGFCTLTDILDGRTGEPTQCENDFPQIVKCMADGRDHVACCVRERVPDICQDLCRGEYTTVTDNVKTHFSCPTHIERTLSCIADGVEILPSEPLNLEAVAVSSTSINVSWTMPLRNADTVTEYVVNVTTLRSFDAPFTGLGYGADQIDEVTSTTTTTTSPLPTKANVTSLEHMDMNDSYVQAAMMSAVNRGNVSRPTTTAIDENAEDKVEAKMMQINVHSDIRSTLISNLQPFTMYEINVRAFNIHGRSLPSVKVRILTLAPGAVRPSPTTAPKIPDIKSCCISKGVSSDTCVTKLCDPKMTVAIEIPDLMICAPWTPDVFTCLADGKSHTPCCKERGIPEPCSQLCSGNFSTRLDFHYFKCLKYMPEYSNCLMESYGVLPSAPQRLRLSNVNQDFAIVHWSPPSILADTVTGYNIHYRPLSTIENQYHLVSNVHYPYILENLYSNAEYEVYVEAVNEHGVSQASQRVVFRTESVEEFAAEIEEETDNYNETQCCVNAGLTSSCMPLCTYDASMSDIRALALTCVTEFHTLLRCVAGGRNHDVCCTRRGVSDNCLGVCNGRVPDSLLSMAENCLPFIGNIVQCFEEGTGLLPGPVKEFHAVYFDDTSVSLSWEAPEAANVSSYEVHYSTADPSLRQGISTQSNSVNVTATTAEVGNLSTNSVYQFYVISHNQHGYSIPSSIIQVQVSTKNYNGSKVAGVVSAPHGVVIGSHSATWVQIVWQPPLFSHPNDRITYRIYHRSVNETNYTVNETLVNTITLDLLKSNSQYIVYVSAVTNKGESLPSETLIAWTDPAHSPFVEPPKIQPAILVEGRSMTVVCVALGDPTPTVSLYINGKLMKQQKNRHLTNVIENVTRDMDFVSCYADNGYGAPAQAARRIQVSHSPAVSGLSTTLAILGDNAMLECIVVAHPEPKLAFWKNSKDGKTPILDGGRYAIQLQEPTPEIQKYKYRLKIMNVTEADGGDYFCQADNLFGEMTKTLNLKIRQHQKQNTNITACCVNENVSPTCMDACSLFMDIDSVIDRPDCLPDFDKLMKCSADGRDHRSCCIGLGVPRRCLDWCRGEALVSNADLCAFQNTKAILRCFQENRDLLPGPPQNVRYKVISENEVIIIWDPPIINPNMASLYRVFWRANGEKRSDKIDTVGTSAHIPNLRPGVNYEAVVKAGNAHGTSVLTSQIHFATEDNSIAYASTGEIEQTTEINFHIEDTTLSLEGDGVASSSGVGVGIGVAFLVILLIAASIGTVWFYRKKQLRSKPPAAIAFENPSYIRETNPDSMHVNGDVSLNGNGPNGTVSSLSVSNGVMANGWHNETLHTPRPETEVAPTLYEELRLGSEGVGFRRLKS